MTAGADTSADQTGARTAGANAVWRPALKEAAAAFMASAVVLAAVYAIWFLDFHPEFQRFAAADSQPKTIPARLFRPATVGSGGYEGTTAIINSFVDGDAVLVLQTRFSAEDYPFIKFNIEGLTTWANAFVFWRRADAPGELFQLPLNRSGDQVTQVAMVYGGDDYKGQITELAIGFFSGPTDHDNNGEPIRLIDAELRPFSPLRVAEQVIEDWTNPPLWQGYSNNIVRGIHGNGMIFPNLVANLLVVTGVLLVGGYRLWRKRRRKPAEVRLLAVALCLCLYGWAFNDVLRWHWRVAQLLDTHERYAGLSLEERIHNNPIRCGRRDDCFEHLLPYF